MATAITIYEMKNFLGFNIPVSEKGLPRPPVAKEKRELEKIVSVASTLGVWG
jgi:hypothetical protein